MKRDPRTNPQPGDVLRSGVDGRTEFRVVGRGYDDAMEEVVRYIDGSSGEVLEHCLHEWIEDAVNDTVIKVDPNT